MATQRKYSLFCLHYVNYYVCVLCLFFLMSFLNSCAPASPLIGEMIDFARKTRDFSDAQSIVECDWSEQRNIRRCERLLENILYDLQNDAVPNIKLPAGESPFHYDISSKVIEVQVVYSEEEYALAFQSRTRPKIEISTGLIEEILYQSLEKRSMLIEENRDVSRGAPNLPLNEENQQKFNEVIDLMHIELVSELAKYQYYYEIYNMITFVIAHELTHIWLDPLEIGRDELESIENRADAYGVILAAQLSPSFRRKVLNREMWVNFGRTIPLIPENLAALQSEEGPQAFLKIYDEVQFSHTHGEYSPISARIDKVNFEIERVLNEQTTELSFVDGIFRLISSEVVR